MYATKVPIHLHPDWKVSNICFVHFWFQTKAVLFLLFCCCTSSHLIWDLSFAIFILKHLVIVWITVDVWQSHAETRPITERTDSLMRARWSCILLHKPRDACITALVCLVLKDHREMRPFRARGSSCLHVFATLWTADLRLQDEDAPLNSSHGGPRRGFKLITELQVCAPVCDQFEFIHTMFVNPE